MTARLVPALLAAFCLCAGATAGGAYAQSAPRPYANPNRPFPLSTSTRADLDPQVQIRERLKKLHDEAAAVQKADGGALTPEHRAELTGKLELIRRDACAAGLAGC